MYACMIKIITFTQHPVKVSTQEQVNDRNALIAHVQQQRRTGDVSEAVPSAAVMGARMIFLQGGGSKFRDAKS